jgi:hypothetical protein
MAEEHSTGGRTKVAAATGTSIAEGIIGLGAVTLSIIALANVLPVFLLSIGIIATGTALLFEGGALSGRFARVATPEKGDQYMRKTGTTLLFIVGVAVIALGVLALIGVIPRFLIPIAIILLGIGLILDSSINARLTSLEVLSGISLSPPMTPPVVHPHEMAREAGMFTVGIQGFVGLAVLALGVLSLIGVQPLTLSLVALMGVGAVQFFNSTAASGLLSFAR